MQAVRRNRHPSCLSACCRSPSAARSPSGYGHPLRLSGPAVARQHAARADALKGQSYGPLPDPGSVFVRPSRPAGAQIEPSRGAMFNAAVFSVRLISFSSDPGGPWQAGRTLRPASWMPSPPAPHHTAPLAGDGPFLSLPALHRIAPRRIPTNVESLEDSDKTKGKSKAFTYRLTLLSASWRIAVSHRNAVSSPWRALAPSHSVQLRSALGFGWLLRDKSGVPEAA